MQTASKFIHVLGSNPQLCDDNLDANVLHRLYHPLTAPPELTPDERLSIRLFLADTDGSDKIYNELCSAIIERHPEDKVLSLHEGNASLSFKLVYGTIQILSVHVQVKKKITELTGITEMLDNMCPNSCMGYTGPYTSLDRCDYCGQPRRISPAGRLKPQQQFSTFPLGPQIQAHHQSHQSSTDMHFREKRMEAIFGELDISGKVDQISDIYEGFDFYDVVRHGLIAPEDTVLMFLMDGAQLFEHKTSHCWIYI